MGDTQNGDDVLVKIDRAFDEVFAVCKGRQQGGRDWTMCVPVRPDDSDVVICGALRAARNEIVALRRSAPEPRPGGVGEEA